MYEESIYALIFILEQLYQLKIYTIIDNRLEENHEYQAAYHKSCVDKYVKSGSRASKNDQLLRPRSWKETRSFEYGESISAHLQDNSIYGKSNMAACNIPKIDIRIILNHMKLYSQRTIFNIYTTVVLDSLDITEKD